MKISYFLSYMVLMAALLLQAGVGYAANENNGGATLEPVGRVVWVVGDFKAINAGQVTRTLKQNDILYQHDTLVTSKGAQAQIVFTDNTMMTFREDTTFYIDHYRYAPDKKASSAGSFIMKLIEGGFRTITGIIAKTRSDDYEVNMPVATIGVRGTDYAAYYHNEEVYVNFYHGKPYIKTPAGELNLSAQTPYAHVPGPGKKPVPVKEQPTVFKEKLKIELVKITPFGPPETPGGEPTGGQVSTMTTEEATQAGIDTGVYSDTSTGTSSDTNASSDNSTNTNTESGTSSDTSSDTSSSSDSSTGESGVDIGGSDSGQSTQSFSIGSSRSGQSNETGEVSNFCIK